MALRPNVPYSPVPSVEPQTGAPDDYIRTQANPAEFGAQIGQATGQFGGALEKVGQGAVNTAVDQIGIINQLAASNAFNESAAARGQILGAYKAKKGLDAVGAQTAVIKQLQDLRTQTIGSLPTVGAQRAYAMLSAREDSYALQGVGEYAAQQLKQAQSNTAMAGVHVAVNAAGDLSTASDDARFGQQLGHITANNVSWMQANGYQNVTHLNADGTVTFDNTPEGQAAQTVFQARQEQTRGAAWTMRIHALADDPASGNVARAWQVFQQNRASIPPEAQASLAAYLQPKVRAYQATSLGSGVVATTDAAYRTTLAAKIENEPISMRPNADQISQAIYGQESGYGVNTATSVTGARGPFQIEPATFAQYAKPGESIDSAADNITVGKRIVADYAAKYGNDPARVAVAYFSGPNNVAPPGSPTPWINNTADPTGKTVASYVGDVVARLGGSGPYQTKADYYRQNYVSIVENARQQAQALHPDDPQFADVAVARVEQQIGNVIKQQDISYRADSDTVYKAFSGQLTNGQQPTSVAALTAINPEVKQAWDRLNAENPLEANVIENHILTAAAKGAAGGGTLGGGFYKVFQEIHAPDGSANRITTVQQLYPLVGQPGGLTMAGLDKARAELIGKQTPDGQAEATMRTTLFKAAHAELTAGNPFLHTKDPKGEEIYLRWMAQAYKQIDEDKAKGLTPQQIYDPASPNYVGKNIAVFKRSPTQLNADLLTGNLSGLPMAQVDTGTAPGNAATQYDLKTSDGIIAAYRAGYFGKGADAADKAKQAAIAAGLVRPNPVAEAQPTVPLH